MDERTWLLYVHTNKINNKKYVGITSMATKQRWANGSGYKGQVFYNAIQKYGWDNFDHEIIVEGLTESEAYYWERLYIKGLNSKSPNGYNITDGGDARSMDRSKFIGVNATNIKPLICLNTLEIFPYQKKALEKYNIFSSAMSQCLNGRALSAGKLPNGEKLLWAHYDSTYDIEHYMELREVIKLRIKNHASIGKEKPIEVRLKTSKPVICITTGDIFYSAKEASRSMNIGCGDVGRCCKGLKSHIKGTEWMYLDEYQKIKNEREVV